MTDVFLRTGETGNDVALYADVPAPVPPVVILTDVYLPAENQQVFTQLKPSQDVRLYSYSPADTVLYQGSEVPSFLSATLNVILRAPGPITARTTFSYEELGAAEGEWETSGAGCIEQVESGGAAGPWEASGAGGIEQVESGGAAGPWEATGTDQYTPNTSILENGLGVSSWTVTGEDMFYPYSPPSISWGGTIPTPGIVAPGKKKKTSRKAVFYSKKATAKVKEVWAVKAKPPAKKAQLGQIQGKNPGSILEWNVAQALDILGLRYIYQMPIGGGRGVKGGQVLDFYVYTPIKPTPILVNGRYWHTGIHNDQLDTMRIKKLLHNQSQDVVVIWEESCQSVEQALTYLRQHLTV